MYFDDGMMVQVLHHKALMDMLWKKKKHTNCSERIVLKRGYNDLNF